jgi:hypothetical protein
MESPMLSSAESSRPTLSWRSWPAFVDGAIDGSVVAFALWTLWYEIALAAQFDLRPSGWPFVVVSAVLVVAGGLRAARSDAAPAAPALADGARVTPGPAVAGLSRPVVRAAGLAVGLVALVVAVHQRDQLGVLPVAVVAILLILVVAAPTVLGGADRRLLGVFAEPRQIEHAVAALVSLATGVLSLFIFKSDADDAFYVNRAAWVAEHGTAALDDTMFGPGIYPQSFGGGLPTPSIEALQGVLASMLHVEAGTVAYLLYAPVLAAVFAWVTWRLVRAWAPRRHLLVLLVALLFVLASGASIVGNYSIGRIWQGKVTAYAVLIPLVWTYFSHLAGARARKTQALLLCAGVAFVGLTTSSALLSPVIAGGALLAALALRSRRLAVGGIAFLVGPVVNGVVQLFGPAVIGNQVNGAATDREVFAIAFGPGTAMVALPLVSMALAAGIARRPAGIVAGAAGLVTLATFLPGVIELADAVTGAGPVVWRLAIAAPAWVFVGLLAAVPVPRWAGLPARGRAAGIAVTAAVTLVAVGVPLAAGHWLWAPEVGARLTSTPTWKVDPTALADVRAARRLDVAPGLWLMPKLQMENLSISTSGPYAVVPRSFYLPTLETSEQDGADRQLLLALVTRRGIPGDAVSNVRDALTRLGVSLACVPGNAPGAARVLAEATGGELRRVGTMRCHVPAP